MKPRLLATAFALAATLTGTLARANVIVVTPTGIPSTIQSAVDVAVDGDVILVETGVYPSFVIRNKSLTVVANTGADVRINGAIRVGNLAFTRSVALSGLKNLGTLAAASPTERFGLRVSKCAGLVFAQDCEFRPTRSTDAERLCVLIESSNQVVLSNCVVLGGDTPLLPNGQLDRAPGGLGASLVSSVVSLYETTVQGGAGSGAIGYSDGLDGGGGIVAVSSRIYLAGSVCSGGAGGAGEGTPPWGFPPIGLLPGHAGAAVQLSVSCLLTTLASTLNGSQILASGSGINAVAGVARQLAGPALSREGDTALLTFRGAAHEPLTRVTSRRGVALWLAPGTQVPGSDPTYRTAPLGNLDASGMLLHSIPIPELGPGVSTRVLFVQGTHAQGSVLRFGSPRALIMLDSTF